jgi:hypothetical protein
LVRQRGFGLVDSFRCLRRGYLSSEEDRGPARKLLSLSGVTIGGRDRKHADRERTVRSVAEGATAPVTLRQKDRLGCNTPKSGLEWSAEGASPKRVNLSGTADGGGKW